MALIDVVGTALRQTEQVQMPLLSASTDPWTWSLETVLALFGVLVGGFGAVSTALVAVLALVQTRRANGLAEAAHLRSERDALYRAVETYTAGWAGGPVSGYKSQEPDMVASSSLRATAASLSPEARDVAQWVLSSLHQANLDAMAHRDGPPDPGWSQHPPWEATVIVLRSLVRSRVITWVASGELDRSPLVEYKSASD